jgi:Zn-dependent peptidase ImmA (M78 family)
MSIPHPWRALRMLGHVRLHWRDDMPEGMRGATNGERIWLSSALSQVERRCTLAHELAHIDAGHTSCQPEDVERRVRNRAARYLLPDPHVIAEALVWARGDVHEAAEVLWVTPRVLRDRLDARHLHPAERAIIVERVSRLEVGA